MKRVFVKWLGVPFADSPAAAETLLGCIVAVYGSILLPQHCCYHLGTCTLRKKHAQAYNVVLAIMLSNVKCPMQWTMAVQTTVSLTLILRASPTTGSPLFLQSQTMILPTRNQLQFPLTDGTLLQHKQPLLWLSILAHHPTMEVGKGPCP